MLSQARQPDATHAYRGYRLQALYCLDRVLADASSRMAFRPEGVEDLAVFDADDLLIEVVQVKAYTAPLTLSDLEPAKPNSFLHRIGTMSGTRPVIISFGPVGPELQKGTAEQASCERTSLINKLTEHGFDAVAAEAVLKRLEIVEVDEAILRTRVKNRLQESLAGLDVEAAFSLLSHWIYAASEEKRLLTCAAIIEQVAAVGRFIADSSAHAAEWFENIVPLADAPPDPAARQSLEAEFREGVSSRWEHVVGGLDVPRPERIATIHEAFRSTNVVIVHGASGQGKTTLAFRYLLDNVPAGCRFQVRQVRGRRHVLRLNRALTGHVAALGIPLTVHLDVSARDVDWAELALEVAGQSGVRLLVTVREEDYNRATVSAGEFAFRDVGMEFGREEAQGIFAALLAKGTISPLLLDFTDTWSHFGGNGPLLEFVHLVTRGTSLQERLAAQVRRLEDWVRCGIMPAGELELLRIVTVASAYGCRVRVAPLVERLKLVAPARALALLEKEYLIRVSEGGSLIQGLHPVRSRILIGLLLDPTLAPWAAHARSALELMLEDDVGVFLLHAFCERSDDSDGLLEFIAGFSPETWAGVAGVLDGLLWLGVRRYVDTNADLIAKTAERCGSGWSWMLDWDLAGASEPGTRERILERVLSQDGRSEVERIRTAQTDKAAVFSLANTWLLGSRRPPAAPSGSQEWAGYAKTCFWVGHLKVASPLLQGSLPDLQIVAEGLPLEDLADVIAGVQNLGSRSPVDALVSVQSILVDRFQLETATFRLEDDGSMVKAYYFVPPPAGQGEQATGTEGGNRLHNETMRRVSLLRRLFPGRETYACQGYGHYIAGLELDHDATRKYIPASGLPASELVRINSMFGNLGDLSRRLDTWEQFTRAVVDVRRFVLETLEILRDELRTYFRKRQATDALGGNMLSARWEVTRLALRAIPLLPKCAVDPWGFSSERSHSHETGNVGSAGNGGLLRERGLVARRYRQLVSGLDDYRINFECFLSEGRGLLLLSPLLGRGVARTPRLRMMVHRLAAQAGVKPGSSRRSCFGLSQAVAALPHFQEEFDVLFSQRIAEGETITLRGREEAVLPDLLRLWECFALRPTKVSADASRELTEAFRERMEKSKKYVLQEFGRIREHAVGVKIIPNATHWKEEPAVWLQMEVREAGVAEKALESVVDAVRRGVRRVGFSDFELSDPNFPWRTVVVAPTFGGTLFDPAAWVISMPIHFMSDKPVSLRAWHRIARPTTTADLAAAGLRVISSSQINAGRHALGVVLLTGLSLEMVFGVTTLPEPTRQGVNIIGNHIAELIASLTPSVENAAGAVDSFATALMDAGDELTRPDAEQLKSCAKRVRSILWKPNDPDAGSTKYLILQKSIVGTAVLVRDVLNRQILSD